MEYVIDNLDQADLDAEIKRVTPIMEAVHQDPEVAKATADQYPPIADLFTIDEFGGWPEATPTFFGDDGIFYKIFAQVQGIQTNE